MLSSTWSIFSAVMTWVFLKSSYLTMTMFCSTTAIWCTVWHNLKYPRQKPCVILRAAFRTDPLHPSCNRHSSSVGARTSGHLLLLYLIKLPYYAYYRDSFSVVLKSSYKSEKETWLSDFINLKWLETSVCWSTGSRVTSVVPINRSAAATQKTILF